MQIKIKELLRFNKFKLVLVKKKLFRCYPEYRLEVLRNRYK